MSGRRGDSDFTLQEGGNGTLPPPCPRMTTGALRSPSLLFTLFLFAEVALAGTLCSSIPRTEEPFPTETRGAFLLNTAVTSGGRLREISPRRRGKNDRTQLRSALFRLKCACADTSMERFDRPREAVLGRHRFYISVTDDFHPFPTKL